MMKFAAADLGHKQKIEVRGGNTTTCVVSCRLSRRYFELDLVGIFVVVFVAAVVVVVAV